MLTLAAKLAYLLRRRPGPDGEPPSNRALSAAIQALPGHTRGGSVGALSNLRSGKDDNPTVSTIAALASVLDTPPPFFLPGWDDIAALTVLQHNPRALDIVRHLDGLDQADLDSLLRQIQDRREQLGLPHTVPADEIDTESDSGDTGRRYRRRRSSEEAAQYAADSLEGL
ncbi:hypothetical protein [Streptomyces xanthochromogenes]|uniref:hypothetical protein n=1 Tax=Streptomyces xanthochromogenes TaxID=67384 RepID=UPI00167A450C|nr:hypothetical protein [Streptomyces xanthochromogenes]